MNILVVCVGLSIGIQKALINLAVEVIQLDGMENFFRNDQIRKNFSQIKNQTSFYSFNGQLQRHFFSYKREPCTHRLYQERLASRQTSSLSSRKGRRDGSG